MWTSRSLIPIISILISKAFSFPYWAHRKYHMKISWVLHLNEASSHLVWFLAQLRLLRHRSIMDNAQLKSFKAFSNNKYPHLTTRNSIYSLSFCQAKKWTEIIFIYSRYWHFILQYNLQYKQSPEKKRMQIFLSSSSSLLLLSSMVVIQFTLTLSPSLSLAPSFRWSLRAITLVHSINSHDIALRHGYFHIITGK